MADFVGDGWVKRLLHNCANVKLSQEQLVEYSYLILIKLNKLLGFLYICLMVTNKLSISWTFSFMSDIYHRT